MDRIRRYILPAIAVVAAVFFTWMGYSIGYYMCRKDITPRAIFFYDINGDQFYDAVVMQGNGRKKPYTCAPKGGQIVCEVPVEKAEKYEEVLNR